MTILSMSHDQNVFRAILGQILCSGTNGPIIFGLGMKHKGYGPYKFCSNDDPRLILTLYKPYIKVISVSAFGKVRHNSIILFYYSFISILFKSFVVFHGSFSLCGCSDIVLLGRIASGAN